MRLFSRLAHGYWYVRGRFQALWAHLRGMNLVERYPPTPELAQAYSEHAPGMSLIGYYSRGIAYAEKSFAMRRVVWRSVGAGPIAEFPRHSALCRLAFRRVRGEVAARRCGCCNAPATTGNSTWPATRWRRPLPPGRSPRRLQAAQRMHQSGLELGDEQASGISLDIWALATGGSVPEEILKQELKRIRHDAQGTAQVLLADGVRLMAQRQYEQAADRFAQALAVAKQAGIVNAYVAPNLAWLATACGRRPREQIGLCAAEAAGTACAAPKRRPAAHCSTARWLQNDLPHALREYAHILALRGKTRRAAASSRKAWRSPSGKEPSTSMPRRC